MITISHSGVQNLIASWHETKLFLQHSVSFSDDSLHVIASVLIQMVAALLLRKPIAGWSPWFAVLAATVMNEFLDLRVEKWPDAAMQYGESLKDLLLTMLLPTVLMLSVRWLPQLYRTEHSSLETPRRPPRPA